MGGVARDFVLTVEEEFIFFEVVEDGNNLSKLLISLVHVNNTEPRPLLTGCSTFEVEGTLIVMGGGAVCFSFGTFWNKGCFSLRLDMPKEEQQHKRLQNDHIDATTDHVSRTWSYLQTVELVSTLGMAKPLRHGLDRKALNKFDVTTVPCNVISSAADFAAIVSTSKPVILQGLELGSCTEKWTNDYLKDLIGGDRTVRLGQKSLLRHKANLLGRGSSSQCRSYGFRIKEFSIRQEALRTIPGGH